MKKIAIITAIILVMLIIMGCDKDKYHRDRYIGDWDFVTEKTTFIGYEVVKVDTIYYLGKITPGQCSEIELIIQYTENDEFIGYVDKDGTISRYCGLGALCRNGSFEGKNKVNFATWDHDWNHSIIGTKKKGDEK